MLPTAPPKDRPCSAPQALVLASGRRPPKQAFRCWPTGQLPLALPDALTVKRRLHGARSTHHQSHRSLPHLRSGDRVESTLYRDVGSHLSVTATSLWHTSTIEVEGLELLFVRWLDNFPEGSSDRLDDALSAGASITSHHRTDVTRSRGLNTWRFYFAVRGLEQLAWC
jgi:hypothetical protein